ncbi:MAG: FAD-dependent oxidoreductase [Kiritimatiellae bacterium]|nr:FAD-dependent oxidoreductase [Kiritimatiellia bacterium]
MNYFKSLSSARGMALIAAASLSGSAVLAADRFVEAPERSVPVIDRVDLVVVGGSEGGMAAAWQAARLGAKVMLLNDEYYLGSEVTAKGRYLLDGPAPAKEFSKALFADMTPSAYRKQSDALLLQAGVVFLNNTRPAGVLIDLQGELCGVVTANKAGLQAVIAKVILDATYVGVVADQAGAARTPWQVKTLSVSRARFKKGGATLNELVKEVPMPELSWPLLNQAETLLRGGHQGAIGNAFAYNLHFVMPTAILAKVNDKGAAFAGADGLDLGVCEPAGVKNLLVLGSSCAVSREAVKALMQPIALAEVGERLGERAVRMAAAVSLPAKVVMKAAAPAGRGVAGVAIRELNERERPYSNKKLETITQPRSGVPVWGDYDLIVVGSGPAGHSAAIAAGRAGVRTLLIEQAGYLGGNTALGIKSFWRGYCRGFNQEWKKSGAAYLKMLAEADVEIWYHTQAMGAVMRGQQVVGVEVATWMGRGAVLGRIIIDASGEGDVCAAAGAELFYVNNGDLCLEEASFKDIGLYANVMPFDPVDIFGATMHHVLAVQAAPQMGWDHMPMVQLRESRRVKGDHVINELDVSAERTYPDVISIAASAFDPHGYYDSDYSFAGLMLSTKHVKESVKVNIPLGAIVPAGLDGIMMVGRCHSTTHDVQAMVRMNPDVINEGYAAGYIAALCVQNNTLPREVDIKALQKKMVEVDILPAEDIERITGVMAEPTEAEIAKAARDPSLRANLLTLARGGERSVLPLQTAFKESPSLAKAKALCLLGDSAGVPLLTAWVEKEPLGKGPAYDWEGFLNVPELDGAMWLLGIPQDKQAVPTLVNKLRECRADTGFNRLRSVVMALGRIGDPQAAPALAEFLNRPGVMGHSDKGAEPGGILAPQFSQALIELFAASALYRCGDADGLGRRILTEYIDDWRGVFVRYAGYVLEKGAPASSPLSQPEA